MFALIDIVKYLTIISYLGILVSTLTGFSDLNDNFDFFKMMVAITIFIHTISTLFVEYINKNKDEMKIIHFARSYNLFMLSMLVLGLSHVGTGFGVFSLTMALTNLFMAIFDCDYDYEPQVNNNMPPTTNVVS